MALRKSSQSWPARPYASARQRSNIAIDFIGDIGQGLREKGHQDGRAAFVQSTLEGLRIRCAGHMGQALEAIGVEHLQGPALDAGRPQEGQLVEVVEDRPR